MVDWLAQDWRIGTGLRDWLWAEELILVWGNGSELEDWLGAAGLALG